MLLVNVHQFDVVFAESVRLGTLEHQVNDIWRVVRLQGQDVFVLSSAEDLGQGDQVDTDGDVAVTAVGGEAFSLQKHGHKGNVGVVHSLKGDSGVIAIEIAVLYEIFNGVDNLNGGELGEQLVGIHDP